MNPAPDLSKTLDELEGTNSWPPTYNSGLVTTVCRLYSTKPLRDFEPGDVRIIIGQRMSLPLLVPLAIACLQKDPWLQATHYEGDLLQNCLQIPDEFWRAHPELKTAFDAVARAAWELEPDDPAGPVSLLRNYLKDLEAEE